MANTTYLKQTNRVGKLCTNSASSIRRDANELRESLPVAWMWAVPPGADVCGVRLGDAEGMGESEMQQNGYSVAFGVHLLTSVIMTSIRVGPPSSPPR